MCLVIARNSGFDLGVVIYVRKIIPVVKQAGKTPLCSSLNEDLWLCVINISRVDCFSVNSYQVALSWVALTLKVFFCFFLQKLPCLLFFLFSSPLCNFFLRFFFFFLKILVVDCSLGFFFVWVCSILRLSFTLFLPLSFTLFLSLSLGLPPFLSITHLPSLSLLLCLPLPPCLFFCLSVRPTVPAFSVPVSPPLPISLPPPLSKSNIAIQKPAWVCQLWAFDRDLFGSEPGINPWILVQGLLEPILLINKNGSLFDFLSKEYKWKKKKKKVKD